MPATPVPILDLSRLERQSMGDPRMEVELLALFMLEVERLIGQVTDATDPHQRGERLDAIAAVARNIGAARLAVAARRAETQPLSGEPELNEVTKAAAETLDFLRSSGF